MAREDDERVLLKIAEALEDIHEDLDNVHKDLVVLHQDLQVIGGDLQAPLPAVTGKIFLGTPVPQ